MFPFIVAAAGWAGGTLCARRIDPGAALWGQLAMGAGLGAALLGLVGFVVASCLGLTTVSIVLTAAAVSGLPLAAWWKYPDRGTPTTAAATPGKAVRRRRGSAEASRAASRAPSPAVLAVYFGLALVLFLSFFRQAVYEKQGTLVTGEWNNIGDLGFHIAITEGFVKGENFPPEHPELAGARLTYPFLADFVAALFVAAGADLPTVFYVESVVLGLAILALLVRWAFVLSGDAVAALLAPLLILFSGGFGFYTLVAEALEQGSPVSAAFARPPAHAVTILWDSWSDILRWANTLTAFLLPQRAWLVGLPLALIVFTSWWQALQSPPETARRLLLVAGIVTGLLPIAHTHSFLVVMGVGACLALPYPRYWPAWARFFAAALALSVPQIVWISWGAEAQAGSFFAWHYGWSNPVAGQLTLPEFWLVNAGLTIPLAIAALVWRPPVVARALRLFLLPFFLCFLIPNFIKLSPWEWDTNKVMFYGYLAMVLPIALLLARMLHGSAPAKGVALTAFALLTLSGALDVWRVASGSQEWVHFDADTMAQARLIEEHTPPQARILSALSASRAVLLTGRRSLVGHPWTMWSHGLAADSRVEDVKKIFAGAPDADELLRRHHIDYVLVGPHERAELQVNDGYLARLEVVGDAGNARLYRVPAG